jgi:hypothetical protein
VIELFQNGSAPYGGRTNPEVMTMVMSGARHSKPSACPEWLYDTVLQCWDIEPSKRPTFPQLERTIREASVQKISTRTDGIGVDADSTSADLTGDAARRSLSSPLSHYEYSDQSTATTPMSSPRGRYVVPYNRETSSSESLFQPVSPTDSLCADDASDGLFPSIGTTASIQPPVSQEVVAWKASLNNLIPVCGEDGMHDDMQGGLTLLSDFSSIGSEEGTNHVLSSVLERRVRQATGERADRVVDNKEVLRDCSSQEPSQAVASPCSDSKTASYTTDGTALESLSSRVHARAGTMLEETDI